MAFASLGADVIATTLKNVLPGNIDKKLADALSEIKRLNQRYCQIHGELAARCDWSGFDAKTKAASAEYERTHSPDDLERLVLAELVLGRVQEKLVPLHRAYAYNNGTAAAFAAEFADWRQKLFATCALKLEKAKAELAAITAAERERLSSEDFSEEELATSPVIKRAANVVRHLEYRLKAIQTDPPEIGWKQNVDDVLDDG